MPIENQVEHVKKLIKNAYRVSKECVAFNFLSHYSKKIKNGEYYPDPAEIFSMAKQFCKNVVLRHDYLPHDFTIILYKKIKR